MITRYAWFGVGVAAVTACSVFAPLGEFDEGAVRADAAAGAGGQGGVEAGAGGDGDAAVHSGGATGQGGKSVDGPCTSNADCIDRGATGAPYRCGGDGKCIALKSGECPLVYDQRAPRHDNPIYIGAFAPLPPAKPDQSAVLYPFRLALDELSGDAQGGLVMPNGERRPLVMVVCDNGASSIDEAAKHLIDEVGVSAILATLLPGDLRRVFEANRDKGVLFLSPVGATSTIVNLDDQDLVWTMLGQPKDLAPVYATLIEDLVEPYLRVGRAIRQRPIKVAVLRGSDAFGLELSDLVVSGLRVNGKTTTDNEADGNYRGYKFDGNLQPRAVVDDLLAFLPDLVISTAGEEITRPMSGVIQLLETEWDGFADSARPFWILSPFNAGDLAGLSDLLATEQRGVDTEAVRRFVGVAAASAEDRTLQHAFAVNLADAFKGANTDTGNYYDAFYYLAYALYAARRDAPTGADIARGMRRLLGGSHSYEVGLAGIPAAMDALKDESETIELVGTLGAPKFDLAHGVRLDPGAVYCFGKVGTGVTLYPDALRFDPTAGKLTGKFPCFSGFSP